MMLSSRVHLSASVQPPDVEKHSIPASARFSEGVPDSTCSLLVMYPFQSSVSQ